MPPKKNTGSHKCLSASTFTVPSHAEGSNTTASGSQMPIGKYIYCTSRRLHWTGRGRVTNAYRQVHLLYKKKPG